MSLPSKPQQIEAVAKLLDSDFTEGKGLEEVAKAIVNGYHDTLLSNIKKPATPLTEGMLFKMPIDNKVRRVAWHGQGRVWVVSETDSYGWLGSDADPSWGLCEEFAPKRRIQVDGKGKMVEMTYEEIAEEWSNDTWKVGDRFSQRQRQHVFEVIATAPQCVLMRDASTGLLIADSNRGLKKYYQHERQVGKVVW